MGLNKWVGIGRLTKEPELKTTQSGIPVCRFTMAINRAYSKDKEQTADFISVVAWRQKAEFVSKYFAKGEPIQVVGSIQTSKYTDSNGNERISVDVNADEVNFVEGYKRNDNAVLGKEEGAVEPPDGFFMQPPDDDDLPF